MSMKSVMNRLSTQTRNFIVNSGYIATIGVSGLVLCAIGSNLNDISKQVQVDITILGGHAFMARGIGSILGSIASASIFHYFQGDNILQCGLVGISFILAVIPTVTSASQLYVYFFLLGLCSSINDTGCNIMVRRLRGIQAGPWLGINGISFGMSAAIVPLVELISNQFDRQYYMLSGLIILVAFYVLLSTSVVPYLHSKAINNEFTAGIPVINYDTSIRYDLRGSRTHRSSTSYSPPLSPDKPSQLQTHRRHIDGSGVTNISSNSKKSSNANTGSNKYISDEIDTDQPSSPTTKKYPYRPQSTYKEDKLHYKFQSTYIIEYLTAVCLFCLVGGQVVFVAYIKEYISRTNILSISQGKYVLMLFWIFVSMGRLIGVYDQRLISLTNVLISHLILCCILGSIAIGFIIYYFTNSIIFILGIIIYALTYGPTVGYCHDLNNRLTKPTEFSTSICMFGLNCGASFVPYITAILLTSTTSASTNTTSRNQSSILLWVIFISMSFPTLAISTILIICNSSSSKNGYNGDNIHNHAKNSDNNISNSAVTEVGRSKRRYSANA